MLLEIVAPLTLADIGAILDQGQFNGYVPAGRHV